jgi:hypothetical protein
MRVSQPDIIEHFGSADAVPQPPERCLELCGVALGVDGMGKLRLSAFGSRSFQALFPAYSIKFCRRLCGVL